MTSEMLDSAEQPVNAAASSGQAAAAVPVSAARDLVHGTSALGTAVLLERGFGFLANLLAARLGGASTFGSYALAITTANNVSTYAAGGIASTAIRFSGRYGRESAGYATLAKTLLIIATCSAAAGALVLWAGAGPLARLLGKASLTPLFQWTALSVAGMILLECCRGFLVGQRQIRGIVLLSSTVGLGLLAFIPWLARVGAIQMIAAQGAITVSAVLLCLFFFRPLRQGSGSTRPVETLPLGPMLREVWTFGAVQLAGLVGLNAAGWWLTSLLARADTSMAQMGFFAIASQVRNMASLAPSLLTESSLAVMAQGENRPGGDAPVGHTQGETGQENEQQRSMPDRVMAVCTWATALASLAVAGFGMALLPWVLPFLYGRAYAGATLAAGIALATAVVHMGSGPAAARVSILSVRTSGVINTIWAALVALAAATFIWWGGDAAKAALIYLGAHVVAAALLWGTLRQRGSLPAGMTAVFVTAGAATVMLVALAAAREEHPGWNAGASALMLLLSGLGLQRLFAIARRERWLANFSQLKQALLARLRARRTIHA